jgi:hypothetical protein
MNMQRLVIGWLFTADFASAISALSNNALNTLPVSRMASVVGLFALVVVYVYATIPGLLAFLGTKASRRSINGITANCTSPARKCHCFTPSFVSTFTGAKHLPCLPIFRFEHFSAMLANVTSWFHLCFPVTCFGAKLGLSFPVVQRCGIALVKYISAKRASFTEFFHCVIPLYGLYYVKI